MSDNGFVIVIDSREQRPYTYPGAVVRTLRAGDYSVLGLEDRVAIERKSKQDAYATIGQGRARFERELERLARLDYAAIVIEASLTSFLAPPAYSRLHPHSAINSLLAWSVRYGVHVFFADSRALSRACVYRLLEKFWREHMRSEQKLTEEFGQ